MRRYSVLLVLLFRMLIDGDAQLKTYLVLDAGPAWDVSRVQDPGNIFTQANLSGTIGGLALWQEIIENFSIGTGAYYHNYLSGINPDDQRPHQPANQSYSALLIPARLSYRIQFSDYSFSLTPLLGYQFGILLNEPVLQNNASLINTPDGVTITYNLQENALLSPTLHLLEAGFSADYRFQNNWQLTVAFSHLSGMKDIKLSTVNYQTSAGNMLQASYSNDGSRFQTTLCLYAPVSNLWEKRDIRLHKRIENSSSWGSGLNKKHYIYFGGNIAALWRSFSTSNPAVGARPITKRGIFRYSNLHTGIYFGYKINKFTGLDIGAYYQRSSTFFSLMYDHEVDYVEKSRAPMFLEFPLMFRYFYDIYDNKVILVPKVGISLLTNFTGPATNSGGGSFEYSEGSGTVSYTTGRLSQLGYIIKAGIGIEYEIPLKIPLMATCDITYNHGLKNIDIIEVSTSLPETPSISRIAYNGTGWMLSIGVKMPILLGKENRRCGAQPMR